MIERSEGERRGHGRAGSRILCALAGLLGAAGVGLSAAAAHGRAELAPAAAMLLAHAPVLAALGLTGANPVATFSGWAMGAGVVLFAGDIALRATAGMPLFPYAAPAGGLAMIAGWLMLSVSALLPAADAETRKF